MKTVWFVALLVGIGLIAPQASAELARIIIDGDFSDWDNITPVYTDPAGDQTTGDIDFGRLWVANDERYLFLSLEVGTEINLQQDNRITLYLDIDENPTRPPVLGDADTRLVWTFGLRNGTLKQGILTRQVYHEDIGLVSAPTVTSTRFEIALDRRVGSTSSRLYLTRFVEWSLRIVDQDGGDRILGLGKPLRIKLDRGAMPGLAPIPLTREQSDHVRVLTYNVLMDGIFDPVRRPAFRRLLEAVDPEIIGFQEIYDHSAQQARAFVLSAVPCCQASGMCGWHSAKPDPDSDIILLSRYPIVGTYPIGTNGAFLVNPRPTHDTELLVVVAHPPCCGNDAGRQWEIDALMAFIRDAKEPGGVLDLEDGTPIIIMGDMNLVGYRQQLETLLTGDIVYTGTYGPQFAPDWDGTGFTDLVPRHTDLPMTYTWCDTHSSFWPGRLDYMIYSDNAVEVGNSFVLFTPAMDPDALDAYGLEADDTATASDHLPVVCDLILPGSMTYSGSSKAKGRQEEQ